MEIGAGDAEDDRIQDLQENPAIFCKGLELEELFIEARVSIAPQCARLFANRIWLSLCLSNQVNPVDEDVRWMKLKLFELRIQRMVEGLRCRCGVCELLEVDVVFWGEAMREQQNELIEWRPFRRILYL